VFVESKVKFDSTTKCELFESIEIEMPEILENAEPSIKSTYRGTIIDLREDHENVFVSMRVNSESISNEIYDSGLECAKHPEQRI
jgi:hypothetical protein